MGKRIAVLAGSGQLPLIFAKCAKSKGEYIIGIAIEDLTSPDLENSVDKIYWGKSDEAKRALEIIKQERISHVVLIGNIPKALVFNKKVTLNEGAQEVLRSTVDSRDYTILKAIDLRLRREGARIMDPTPYITPLIPKKGLLTKRPPTKEEWEDIKFGQKAAKRMAGLDIGQTVIVKNKLIVAVEAIEGTDKAIRRAGEIGGEGTVVVKMARPKQDMKFDIPTIGCETIDSLIAAKASVLAIEAGKMLVLNRDELIRKSNSANISVIAI